MAIEAERLLATFEARFTSLEKALAKARTDSKATFTVIEGEGRKAENALANIGKRGVPGMEKFNKTLQSTRMNTANVAAQFNDIGVQLAGGQSPFLIAIQQGTQLNQVLGGLGAKGIVSALGGAFTSLLNPISLATIAIIGLGGTAVQYFAEMLSSGEKSGEQLQKEAQLIQQVADKWGDALPAIREYANERARLAGISDLRQGAAITVDDIFNNATNSVKNFREAITAEFGVILSAAQGDMIRAFKQLQVAIEDFEREVQKGGDTSDEFARIQTALSTIMNSEAVPATGALRDAVDALGASYGIAAGEALALAEAARAAALSGPIGGETVAGGKGNRNSPAILSDMEFARRVGLDDYGIKTERPKGKSSGGGKSEAEREREAVLKLIEALQFEQDMIGATNEERRVANALRDAGSYATDAQKAQIESLVVAIEQEREALKKSEEAMKAINDLGRDVLGGIINDLRQGKTGAEAFAGALDRVADRLLDLALDSLFSGKGGLLGGSSGKGLLGGLIIPGILHGGGVAGQDGYGHGRAFPASVFAGARRMHSGGMVGSGEVPTILQRGELVVPKGARAGGGSPSIVINAPINAPGADPAALARVERSVQELGKSVGQRVDNRSRAANVRNIRA